MTKLDYYQVLGISKNANDRDIKKAYKKLAMKFHPDHNPNNPIAESKFKEIKEAYEILINPEKRSSYDQFGHSNFYDKDVSEDKNTSFSDIFSDVFGDIFGNQKKYKQKKGSDIHQILEIDLEEAVKGVTKEIKIYFFDKCNDCNGSGIKYGKTHSSCSYCKGKGQIQIRQGFFIIQQTCNFCSGKGKIIRDPCNKCYGKGICKKFKFLSIKIPAGIDDGDNIKLSEEGELSDVNSKKGDLYIKIKIKPHDILKRENNNLYCEIPINFSMASLGGEIEIPTLDGKIILKIPPETQTGKLFRIKGKGIKTLKNNIKGDLLCKVIIETPIKLNERQKQILKELGDSFNKPSFVYQSPKYKKFLENIKKFFDNLIK